MIYKYMQAMRNVHTLVVHSLYYHVVCNSRHHLVHMCNVTHMTRRDNHVMISRSPTQIRNRSRA